MIYLKHIFLFVLVRIFKHSIMILSFICCFDVNIYDSHISFTCPFSFLFFFCFRKTNLISFIHICCLLMFSFFFCFFFFSITHAHNVFVCVVFFFFGLFFFSVEFYYCRCSFFVCSNRKHIHKKLR